MKKGLRVRTTFDKETGTSLGPVFRHSIWWILVEWDNGRQAIAMEQCLEVIDEDR